MDTVVGFVQALLTFPQVAWSPFYQLPGLRVRPPRATAPDMCFCETMARDKNLSQDFNLSPVTDATPVTFPANTNGGVDEEA